MERVTHDGRTTAFRVTDPTDGSTPAFPTLCYVHGSGGTHRVWAAQYGPDRPGGRVAAVDLSGHGESGDVDVDPGPPTLTAYVEDVLAVARATDADVLVGNSLGGAVVLQLVLEADLDPAGLVLVGSGAKLAVAEPLRRALEEDFEAAVEALHEPDRLFHDPPPALSARSREELLATGQAVTRRDFLTCHEFDVRDRLDEVATPTLAVCGEHDELTPPAYHEYLAREVRDGRSETIPGAAHLAMAERPDAFGDVLERFLDERVR